MYITLEIFWYYHSSNERYFYVMPLTQSSNHCLNISSKSKFTLPNIANTFHYTTILVNTRFFLILSQICLPLGHAPEDVNSEAEFSNQNSKLGRCTSEVQSTWQNVQFIYNGWNYILSAWDKQLPSYLHGCLAIMLSENLIQYLVRIRYPRNVYWFKE